MAKYYTRHDYLPKEMATASGKYTQYVAVNDEDASSMPDKIRSEPRIATVSVEHGAFVPADNTGRSGQLRLFDHIPARIGNLGSDPSMRHVVPTLLAMATEDRGIVTHDDDLTEHSSKMIGRLKGSMPVSSPTKNPSSRTTIFGYDKNTPVTTEVFPLRKSDAGIEEMITSGEWFGDEVAILHRMDNDTVRRSQLRGRQIVQNLSGRTPKLSPQFEAINRYNAAAELADQGISTYDPNEDPNAMKFEGM